MDMLSRAQCLRVDDQRGLLTKEQLEIPLFLQLPSDQGQDTGASESTEAEPSINCSKSTEKSEDQTLDHQSSDSAAVISDSAKSGHKDVKETTV